MSISNLESALNYLRRDYLLNASILEPIRTNTVDLLYAEDGCVFAKDRASEVYLIQTERLELAERLIGSQPVQVLVAYNQRLEQLALNKLGFVDSVPCYQGVYRGNPFDLPVRDDFSVRAMREEEADEACLMYHFDRESALKHIRLGYVYGGYDREGVCAMIGMHLQGSMGLLYVKERARRRGYARILEEFLINSLLEKGLVPYCHVVEGNTASLSLQRRLGLEMSETMLYWLHRKER